jgi:hypothetical protein
MTGRAVATRHPTIVAASVIFAAVVNLGCGILTTPIGLDLASKTSFEADWHRYTRVRASKAFAYAGDPMGLSVTGIAYNMPSPVEAEARALDYCEEQRVARGLASPCVLLAIDDEVVRVSAERPLPTTGRVGS